MRSRSVPPASISSPSEPRLDLETSSSSRLRGEDSWKNRDEEEEKAEKDAKEDTRSRNEAKSRWLHYIGMEESLGSANKTNSVSAYKWRRLAGSCELKYCTFLYVSSVVALYVVFKMSNPVLPTFVCKLRTCICFINENYVYTAAKLAQQLYLRVKTKLHMYMYLHLFA